jgi:phosphoribosylformylglycinamidine synthase
MNIYLDRVPLRDDSLSPEEILMSESQERMCAVIKPEDQDHFMKICDKWDVPATVIGEVTSGEFLKIYWKDDLVVQVPPKTVAHEGPVYQRPLKVPDNQSQMASKVISPPIPGNQKELELALIKLLGSANIADKSWVTSQYDRYVRGNTVMATSEDSGMIRVDESTQLGIAISCDSNARWCELNPYNGVQLALVESAVNIATTGAKPLAVSNCLNFGSPEVPEVMWQFSETVRGLADACLEMNLPVTGGNVSFYNQTKSQSILPTPVIAVLGTIDDVRKRTKKSVVDADLDLFLLGEQEINFAGSAWAYLHNLSGGSTPDPNLPAALKLIKLLLNCQDLFEAAHDVSEGGIATTLFEMFKDSRVGFSINIQTPELFSESPARVIVATDNAVALRKQVKAFGVKATEIGRSGGSALVINGFKINQDLLEAAHSTTFQQYFGIQSKNG